MSKARNKYDSIKDAVHHLNHDQIRDIPGEHELRVKCFQPDLIEHVADQLEAEVCVDIFKKGNGVPGAPKGNNVAEHRQDPYQRPEP